MYADIGPSPGEGLHCEAFLRFQDDNLKVEYAEVKSLNHEPTSQSPGIHVLYIVSPACALHAPTVFMG